MRQGTLIGTSIAVVCIAAFALLANSFQELSVRQDLFVLNGQGPFYGNNIVTVQCEPGNYNGQTFTVQVAGFDGQLRTALVKCNQATHLYSLDIKGYTYYDGQLQSFIYAAVTANWNWNITNGDQFVDPQGNPLRVVPKRIGLGSAPALSAEPAADPGGTIIDPVGGINVVQCGATQAVNQFFGGILSGVLGPTTAASGCGGPYINMQTFLNYVKAQDNVNKANEDTWKSQLNMLGVLNKTTLATSQAVNAINASLDTVARYAAANNAAIKYQYELNANNTAFLLRMSNNINEDLIAQKAATSQSFSLISGLAGNMATFVNQTSGQFEQVTLQIAQATATMTGQVNQVTEQVNFIANQQVLNLLSMTTQFLQLQSLVVNWNQNTQLKRDVAKIFSVSANYQIEQEGREPFLPDLGIPPPADISNLPPALATTTINVITRQFLYNDPAFPATMPTMAVIQFAWKCSTAAIGANPTIQGSYADTLGALGPRNCSGPIGSNICQCWIEVTDTRAPIQSSANDPEATALLYWRNGLNPVITPTIPNSATPLVYGGQSSNIRAGPFNGRRLTSSMEYIDISESICRLNVSEKYILWTRRGNSGSYRPGYNLYSSFNSTTIVVPWDNATCYINIQKIMQPPPEGPFPPMYAEIQFAQTAYNLAVQQLDPVLLWGNIPNRLTWSYEPTATLAGGVVNALWRYHYMAFVPLTLSNDNSKPYYGSIPVWQLTFIKTEATISVKVEDEDWVTYPATNVFNPGETTLFDDGYVGMGDPMLMWDGSAKAFNAPQAVLPLNPTKQGTCGTPIYNMANSPKNMTYLAWVANSGITYDHTCGSNVARVYEQALIESAGPTQGTCDPNPALRNPAATGTLCNTLNYYAVTPSQEDGFFTLTLSARGSSTVNGDFVTGIVTLPAGEVRNVVSSSCPTATQVIQGYNTIQVVFTNGLTTTNTIRVRRVGQCPVTTTITLPPLAQGAPFIVPFCPGNPPGQQEQLLVETLSPNSTSTLTACSLVNVTVDYQQPGILNSPATSGSVRQYTAIGIDQTSVTQQAILNGYVAQTFSAIIQLYNSQLDAGLQIAPEARTALSGMYDTFIRLQQASQEALANNTQRAIGNYSGQAADYQQFYQQNAADSLRVQADMNFLLNQLFDRNKAVSDANEALSKYQLLLQQAMTYVASNVSTLAYFTNQTAVFLKDGTRVTLGDLLGNLIGGFAKGIGDAAEELADSAGDILKKLVDIPAGLLQDLLTTIAGPILMIVTGALAVALLVGMVVMGVYMKKLMDRVDMLEKMMGIRAPEPSPTAFPFAPGINTAAASGVSALTPTVQTPQPTYAALPMTAYSGPGTGPVAQQPVFSPMPPAQQPMPMAMPAPPAQVAQLLPPGQYIPGGLAITGKKGADSKKKKNKDKRKDKSSDEDDTLLAHDDYDPHAEATEDPADA